MRYLSSVFVHGHRSRVGLSKGSLLIHHERGKSRVPLEGVDALTVIGSSHVTADAMAACVQRQIRVACLTRGGRIRFVVGGPRGGNVHLRMAQFEAASSPERSLRIATSIVASKINGADHLVRRWARDAEPDLRARLQQRSDELRSRLERTPSVRDLNHLRGIEGDAARSYFRGMGIALLSSHITFAGRNRRPPRDIVNATLGFGYGLAETEITGALDAAGLDHQIGFLHRARSGRASLSLDLLEEVRPLVDRFVVRTLRRRQLTGADFDVTPGGAVYLSNDGRSKFLALWERSKEESIDHRFLGRDVDRFALPSVQATLLARHLRGDLADYPPYVMRD